MAKNVDLKAGETSARCYRHTPFYPMLFLANVALMTEIILPNLSQLKFI